MKVAILGAAHPHVDYALEEVAHRDELELVAAAEPDPTMRGQFLGPLTGVPVYADFAELLAAHDVDVALVAGIYARRAEATLLALDAGAHVLADKPLCTSTAELEAISAAAQRAGRHVSIVFEKRFYPATIALRRLLADGVLGDLALVASTGPHKLRQAQRPGWFLDPVRYGGIAADLPIHDIDLVLALTGATSGVVAALTGNARPADHPGFDDHVALLMRAGDVAATIEASWLGPEAADVHGHYRMRVTGSEGTAELDWAYHRLRVTTHDRPAWDEPLGEPVRPAAYFFDAVLRGEEPMISTAAGLLATRVALTAQRSAERGGELLTW